MPGEFIEPPIVRCHREPDRRGGLHHHERLVSGAQRDAEVEIPEVNFDYCFLGDEMGFKWTVLVGKERKSKSFFATAVPSKELVAHSLLISVLNSWGKMGMLKGRLY